MKTRILIADDDTLVCRVLRAALEKDGFEVDVVQDGTHALSILESENAPRLALLDWLMPGLDGIEVCRRLRASSNGAYTHVLLMSGRNSEEDILQGLDGGADGFITKPFDPQVVLARLHAALRRMHNEGAQGLRGTMNLLREASRGTTGDVLVRSQERVGHVMFYQGKVAWVQVSGGTSLIPLLAELGVGDQEARLALDECRRNHQPFMDTLVKWNLVSQEALQNRFRTELSARLATLLSMPSITAFFVPETSSFQSGFLYDLAELELPGSTPSSLLPAKNQLRLSLPPPSNETVGLADEVMRLAGIVGVVVLDLATGETMVSRGQPASDGLLRKMLRLFMAESKEESFDEVLLASEAHYHLMRNISREQLIYARVDRKENPNIGLVRFFLTQSGQGAGGAARS